MGFLFRRKEKSKKFRRTHELDMVSGPLFSRILFFAIPIMVMNILQLLFNAADMVVVGRFSGSSALAAVGATGSLISLMVNLFMGLSVGSSVIVARDYGARRVRDIRYAVHTSLTLSFLAGIFVLVFGQIFCAPLLRTMGTPEDIIGLSIIYMRVYFLGVPASMVYNFGAAILRSTGDSQRPMYFLTISGMLNVVLNLLFVITLRMGVAGVAWATVISQYVALSLIMASLSRNEGALRFSWHRLGIEQNKLREIVRIGLPAGLQSLLFSVSNVLIQSAVNSFGSVMVAASAASSNVEGLVSTAHNSYYNAAITFTGQNLGAGKHERIDKIAQVITMMIFFTWLLVGGGIVLGGRWLLSLYTANPEVIELGMLRMRVMMAGHVFCGIMSVFPGFSRAMGFSVLPMLCTLIGNCLVRIIWLATVFQWYPTIWGLFLAYPVSWAIAAFGQVGVFFYARQKIRQRASVGELSY